MSSPIAVPVGTQSGEDSAGSGNGAEAYLLYTEAGAKTLDFTRTYVPDTLRHRNIGEAIVKHALDYAAENAYDVIPTCPFVKWVLGREPR